MPENPEDVIWRQTVDDETWECKVVRHTSYTGILTVRRVNEDKEILREQVGLSYQAMFGPDISDVAAWQDRCLEVIDAQGATDGTRPEGV